MCKLCKRILFIQTSSHIIVNSIVFECALFVVVMCYEKRIECVDVSVNCVILPLFISLYTLLLKYILKRGTRRKHSISSREKFFCVVLISEHYLVVLVFWEKCLVYDMKNGKCDQYFVEINFWSNLALWFDFLMPLASHSLHGTSSSSLLMVGNHRTHAYRDNCYMEKVFHQLMSQGDNSSLFTIHIIHNLISILFRLDSGDMLRRFLLFAW